MIDEFEQFIETTYEVIREEGFDDYLPTLLLPDQRKIFVLESEFNGDNHETPVDDWVAEKSVRKIIFWSRTKWTPSTSKLSAVWMACATSVFVL